MHFVTPPQKKTCMIPKLPWFLPGLSPEEIPVKYPEPPIPTKMDCYRLWEKYRMLEHIGRHSQTVADFAVSLAQRAVDLGLATHDLVPLTQAAGLLHDIAKSYSVQYGGSHAQIGASWVISSTGHRRIAQAVFYHVEWYWQLPQNIAKSVLAPIFFVIYADKRTKHDQIVTLDERCDDLLIRYGKTPESRAAIERGRRHVLTIERLLSTQLALPTQPIPQDSCLTKPQSCKRDLDWNI